MYLIQNTGGGRLDRSRTQDCPDCGHEGVVVTNAVVALVHRVSPRHDCRFTEYDAGLRRDGRGTCRSGPYAG